MASKSDADRDDDRGVEMGSSQNGGSLPAPVSTKSEPQGYTFHPALYVVVWISLSSSVILYNKWILDTLQFRFPIFLTTWHLIFATIATQVLARTTKLLDGRKTVRMTGKVYLRAIVPIGLFFSLSLICGNQAYLYLSVAFIQMLKATTPVAVLVTGWIMAIEKPNWKVLGNVSFIVIGVIVASYGELKFVFIGFLFQAFGILFEATRLVMVQRLLSSAEYKMDPLVSLYYFAPVCAVMNFLMFMVFEFSSIEMSDFGRVGIINLVLNAAVAFGLNVSVVFLIGKTSSLVLTLCGVLKDILLVCASVMIWGTMVTWLQMFGYSIALGGLVYYKLGADKLREHYMKLRSDGNDAWEKYSKKYPIWRKAAVAGGILFFVLLLFGGFRYHSAKTVIDHPINTGGVPAAEKGGIAKRDLDIVVSYFQEDPVKVKQTIDDLSNLKVMKGRKINVILYNKNDMLDLPSVKSVIKPDEVVNLDNRGREGGTYLSHIINRWDNLAKHTLFIQGSMHEFEHAKNRLEDFFTDKTGVMSIGFGHARCKCTECKDPFGTTNVWNRVPEIYSAVYGELCPNTDILMSYTGQFVVSDKRIRGTPLHIYEHLKSVLESDLDHWIHEDKHSMGDKPSSPSFGHTIERSWMIMFHCADPRLADHCPKLGFRRGEGEPDDKCQCLDDADD